VTLTNLAKLDICVIGGALHSYWPIDYSNPLDKAGDRARGLEGISSLADFAADLDVNLCLEVLNRFENHVLNTVEEGVAFVREIGKPNVNMMLDTFHMNIEEGSFGEAIRTAGPFLSHFHTGKIIGAFQARVACLGTKLGQQCARLDTAAPSSWSRS
jgi:D-psicose/D-tagatose/L-ribulose 3-epimerase